MQKRLLALVATVAMVLSMFAGVAFAAPGDLVLTVDTTEVVRDLTEGATVSGTFTGTDNTAEVTCTVTKGTDTVAISELVVESGTPNTFSFKIPGNTADGTYTITLVEGDKSGTATFKVVTANKYTMHLGTKQVISSGSAPLYQTVAGTITRTGTASDAITDFVIDVKYDVGTGTESQQLVHAPNGQFSFILPTNIKPQNVELHVFAADANWEKGVPVEELNGTDAPIIKVRYNVTTTPADLTFAFTGAQNPVTITGKVTDSNGNPVEGATVKLNATDDQVVGVLTTNTNDAGEFGLIVLEWKAAAKFNLEVAEIAHKTVEVEPKAATLTVSPKNAVRSLVSVPFTVKGDGFPNGTVTIAVLDSDDKTVPVQDLAGNTAVNGEFTATFKWMPTASGTYTVKATSADDTVGATATITVQNPLGYNFINADQLDTLIVGENNLVFGKPSGTYLATFDGTTVKDNFLYDVYVDGKLKLEKQAAGTVTINTTKLGSKTIKVVAFNTAKDPDDNWVRVYEQTFESKIEGWDVTIDPKSLTVDQAQNVTIVVKDKDGNPVNNATIEIVDTKYKLGPTNYNAQNGTYVFEDVKIAKAGDYTVTVQLIGATEPLKATLKLNVVGQKVYDVSSDVDALLQGKEEKVKLTITKDGVAVIPQRITLVYADGTTEEVTPTYLGDGVTQVSIKAKEAGELTIRPETFDKNLCGEVVIDVVAPKLVLVDEEAANLTENFNTKVGFKIVDPRNDSVIKTNVELAPEYATIKVKDANDGVVVGNILLGAEEHTITVLATEADYDAAEEEEVVVAVYLKVYGVEVDGHFEVKPATITSDPEMIIIGAKNNLTLTYLDANGKPIEGKAVKANGTKIGETDANGQVVYPAGVVASAVEVTADTDVKDVTVDKTIKIGYDFEAPQVTYEVDGNKATLIITDNVRLVRINIDGKDIDFWPGARYEHVVTLNPGVNKVRVKAQDSNDNVLDEVVEIEYKTESVVLEGDKVQRQGDYTFVQARQFEELGAKFAWDNASKTATFTVGDTTVEVTIGSTTAKINGEAVTMPAAPYISNDRTYIPVRFVSESLGWGVHWVPGDIITITL